MDIMMKIIVCFWVKLFERSRFGNENGFRGRYPYPSYPC